MFKFKNNNIIIIVAILLILIIINYLFFKKNIENYYNTDPTQYFWLTVSPDGKKFNPTVITYNTQLSGSREAYAILGGEIVKIKSLIQKSNNNFVYNIKFKEEMKFDAMDVAYDEHKHDNDSKKIITDIFARGSDNFMYHWRNNDDTPDFTDKKWRKISFSTTNFSYSNRRCFIISDNSLYYFPNFLEGFKASYNPSDDTDYFTKLGGYKINICPINVNLKQVCYNFKSENTLLLTQDGMIYYCKNNLNNLMMNPITWKLLETTVKGISYIYLFHKYLIYISNNQVYIHNLNNNKSVKINTYPSNFKPVTVCVGGVISESNNYILLQDDDKNTFYSKMINNQSLE